MESEAVFHLNSAFEMIKPFLIIFKYAVRLKHPKTLVTVNAKNVAVSSRKKNHFKVICKQYL